MTELLVNVLGFLVILCIAFCVLWWFWVRFGEKESKEG